VAVVVNYAHAFNELLKYQLYKLTILQDLMQITEIQGLLIVTAQPESNGVRNLTTGGQD
jgi:hypothetical protein